MVEESYREYTKKDGEDMHDRTTQQCITTDFSPPDLAAQTNNVYMYHDRMRQSQKAIIMQASAKSLNADNGVQQFDSQASRAGFHSQEEFRTPSQDYSNQPTYDDNRHFGNYAGSNCSTSSYTSPFRPGFPSTSDTGGQQQKSREQSNEVSDLTSGPQRRSLQESTVSSRGSASNPWDPRTSSYCLEHLTGISERGNAEMDLNHSQSNLSGPTRPPDNNSIDLHLRDDFLGNHKRRESKSHNSHHHHSRRSAHRTHRRKNSSRNFDSFDSGPMSMALVAPTFIPGMPSRGTSSGLQVEDRPPGGIYWALITRFLGEENDIGLQLDSPNASEGEDDALTMPIQMCQPPLRNIVPAYPQALDADPQPRVRKQSKYTAEQDKLILELKNKGKSWAEIARLAGCHNQLAARNRYQVLIGQQGGGTFFWTAEDCAALQDCLDEAERAKWIFIAQELSRKRDRRFTLEMVHYKISQLFGECCERFGVTKTRDPSKGGAPFKRTLLHHPMADRSLENA